MRTLTKTLLVAVVGTTLTLTGAVAANASDGTLAGYEYTLSDCLAELAALRESGVDGWCRVDQYGRVTLHIDLG
jgi:hypothetical protein